MARRSVEVVVDLFDILPVIAFAVSQAEQPLLEDRIPCVPQREPDTQALFAIRKTGDAILTPAVSATAGMIMGKVFPGIAVCTVVFADGSPLPFRQVGAPFLPAFAFGKW